MSSIAAQHPESDQPTVQFNLNNRQRLLLGMLDVLGGTAKNLDFQKLLFLFCRQSESKPLFDFVPYKFGAFSFTSYADRRKLTTNGLLVDQDGSWVLSDIGRGYAREARTIELASFINQLGNLRGDALVAETYRRFPFFAIRSEIADRVLRGDQEALDRIQVEKLKVSSEPLQTIGYEGHSLESYLNTLISAGVTILCDVRRNPLSRKYGFSKTTLSNACVGVGIRYEHLPELGIASEFRQDLQTQNDYDALFVEYETEWLPKQGESLQKIQSWINDGEAVALTCFELLPHQCHRHCVAEALEKLSTESLSARHL